MKKNCSYSPNCPACSLWHIALAEEHQHKKQRLARILGCDPGFVAVMSVGEQGLRDFYDLQYQDGRWGFRASAETRELIDLPHCPLLSPTLSDWYQELRHWTPPFQKASLRLRVDGHGQRGLWLDLAHEDTERLLHSNQDSCEWLVAMALVEVGQQRKKLIRKPNGAWGLAKTGAMGPWFTSRHKGQEVPLWLRIGDFSQVSRRLNQRMLEQFEQLITPDGQVLEIGSGSGNLTLPALGLAKNLWALESMKSARENWLINVASVNSTCTADLIREQELAEIPADTLVLNPPRSGLGHLWQKLNWRTIKSVIILTCAPENIAFNELTDQGFQLTTASLVDQFPRTEHIEALVSFSKC